ncbi:metallophosphoesterase [Bradyrhizobium vignae]|uniref:Calcineurin-like phosphoesterase domain-containing protein n=1 Tax=Bradyrhizobium vignae TaxID=1549949 RepID=A0A2U3PUE5_9BRAD|nr:metallophosphoesterase [Bradyrhizobium vignae]SPP92744.1 protein of unknown function [Bradyrhizobium vignae]
MTALNVLHLSDLHYRGEQDHDVKIVLNALTETIGLHASSEKIDLVVFSGDLVQSGADRATFEQAIHNFVRPLLVECKLDSSRFVICPGNHDIDRDVVRGSKYVELGLLASLRSREQINAFIDEHWTMPIAGTIPPAFARLSKFYETQWIAPNPSRHFANLFLSIHSFDIGPLRIGVALFNTAWRTTGEPDDVDRNRLVLGERVVDRAVDMMKDCDLRIAVYHHPLNWLIDDDELSVEGRLQSEFDLLMCGHVHNNSPQYRKTVSGDAILSQGAALYVSRKYFDGFSILNVRPDERQAKMSLFEYSDQRRVFTPATRIVEGGQIILPFADSRARAKPSLASTIRRVKSVIRQQANKHLSLIGTPSGAQDIDTHFVCPPFDNASRAASSVDQDQTRAPKSILASLLAIPESIAFIGRSEHGKTSLGHYVAVQVAEGNADQPRLPLLCQFAAIKKHTNLFWQLVRNRVTEISEGTIQRSLVENEAVFVIVDDVDLFDTDRLTILKQMISEQSNARWCLLVRNATGALSLINTTEANFPGFKVSGIGELDRRSIRALSAQWLNTSSGEVTDAMHRAVMEQIQRTGLPRSGYIVSLMLWAMLNRSKGELINEAVLLQNLIDFMLGRMDYSGALRREFDFHSKSVVLQALAYWFKTTDEIKTKNDVVARVIQFLHSKALTYDATKIVDGFISCGIFSQVGETISFRYRRFQEFFVAGYFADNPSIRAQVLASPNWIDYTREFDLYTARFRHEGDLLDFVKAQIDSIDVPEPSLDGPQIEQYLASTKDPEFVATQIKKMRKEPMTAEQIDALWDSADRRLEERERKQNGKKNERGSIETYFVVLEFYSELLRNLEFVDRERKKLHLDHCVALWEKGLRGILSGLKEVVEEFRRELEAKNQPDNTERTIKLLTFFEEAMAFAWPAALSDTAYQNLGSEKLVDLLDELAQERGTAPLKRLFALFILLELDPARSIKRFSELASNRRTERWVKSAIVQRLFAYYHSRPLSASLRGEFEALVADLELDLMDKTKANGALKSRLISKLQQSAYKESDRQ